MAKYKVITLAMAVKNNRIAKFGELVDDSELTLNPSALIEGGYMEKVEEVDEKEVVEDSKSEKDLLLEKYFELTETKAPKNISIDKLKEKIAEAEAEAQNK